jgi:hypothetical protein
MSSIAVRSVLILAAMAVLLAIASLIVGLFVYRDAKKRGMPALRWALIAAFFPALMGFIIYLLTRLPRKDPSYTGRETGLYAVFAALMIIPCILLFLSDSLIRQRDSGLRIRQRGNEALTINEYCERVDVQTAEKVRAWFENLPTVNDMPFPPSGMLRYDSEYRGEPRQYYLAALPYSGRSPLVSVDVDTELFASCIKIEAIRTEFQNDSEYTLFSFSVAGGTPDKIKVKVGLDDHPSEITVVDYNPTTLYIVPDYSKADPNDETLFLPERLSVSNCEVKKTGGGHQFSPVGSVVIEDRSKVFEILKTIDSAETIDTWSAIDSSNEQDYNEAFIITAEYRIRPGFVMHEDMVSFCVRLDTETGECIIDERFAARFDHYSKTSGAFMDRLRALFDD